MRFIGHLDLMRHFQKALRRSGLPIKFSEGMSPHMIMSFASPLGLGLTSTGEYVDMEFARPVTEQELIEGLNRCLVSEVRILSCRMVADGHATNAMSLVAGADYFVSLKPEEQAVTAGGSADWRFALKAFLEQPAIEVMKESKKGEKLVDIRPLIFSVRPEEEGLFMQLSAGSAANLKPELVIQAYEQFAGISTQPYAYSYIRRDMYARDAQTGALISLGELGERI